jgi:hypothetical protein
MQSADILALVATAVAEREEMGPAPVLIEAFAAVPDPRRRRGRRYPCRSCSARWSSPCCATATA